MSTLMAAGSTLPGLTWASAAQVSGGPIGVLRVGVGLAATECLLVELKVSWATSLKPARVFRFVLKSVVFQDTPLALKLLLGFLPFVHMGPST